MKKIIIFIFLLTSSIFAKDISVNVEIKDVKVNGGKLYMEIHNSSEDYKKKKAFLQVPSDSKTVTVNVPLDLPEGEYLFSVYQDVNSNGKLDTNFLGMPKEPVGISNYKGKGIPGGFDKLKMKIDENSKKVIVNLVEL